jgi:hypothetical protein
LHYLKERAEGRIWEKIAAFLSDHMDPETWWKLQQVYSAELSYIRSGVIWEKLTVPTFAGETSSDDRCVGFQAIRNVGEIIIRTGIDEVISPLGGWTAVITPDGQRLGPFTSDDRFYSLGFSLGTDP